MKPIKSVLIRLSQIGVDKATNLQETHQIVIVNQISLIFILLSAPYFTIFLTLNLTVPAYWVIPSCLSYIGCIFLNKFRYPNSAAISIILFSCVILLYFSCVLGKASGAHYVYFALVLLPLVLFGVKKKLLTLIGFFLPIFTLLLLEYTNYSIFLDNHLSLTQIRSISIFAAITTFSIIIGSAFFYHISKENAEENLKNARQDIESAYFKLHSAYMELEKAQKERIQLLQEQEKSSKIAAELAGIQKTIVALKHELNSPLTAVILGTQALEKETRQDKIEQITKIIQEASLQMKTIMKRADSLSVPKTTEYLYGVDMLDLS